MQHRLANPLNQALNLLLLGLWMVSLWVGWPMPDVWAQDFKVNYTLSNLQNQDFANKDLHGTSFAGALMQKSDFHGANLKGTILTKGTFFQADLSGADLTSAFADRVVFSEANLTNANLTNAVLTASNFYDAAIAGADFTDALVDRYEVDEMCKRAEGVNPTTGIATRDSLGCP